jgi:hypothetical protein
MHTNATGYTFQHEAAIYPALQASGYLTGGFGKILNGQGKIFVPKDTKTKSVTSGFDWLSLPLDEGDYFANIFFEKRPNGTTWVSSLGKKAEVVDTWYQTSQIGNRSLEFIRHAVAQKRPFAAYLGPHAPHYSADAPPWAQELFSDMQAPRLSAPTQPPSPTPNGRLRARQHTIPPEGNSRRRSTWRRTLLSTRRWKSTLTSISGPNPNPNPDPGAPGRNRERSANPHPHPSAPPPCHYP